MNPVDIDKLITEKIEAEIEDIEWISSIDSNSSVWLSSVTVELENGIETRDVMTDIRDRIDTIAFPSDAEDTTVQDISTKNQLLFEALLYSEKDISRFSLLSKARVLQSELEWKWGIAEINFWGQGGDAFSTGSGDEDYEIKVRVSWEKLESLGLTLAWLASTLRAENANTPLGNYELWELSYDFRFDGEFRSLEDIGNTVVAGSGISLVKLKDIATLSREYADDSISRLWAYEVSGYNYVTLSFNKKIWDNVFQVSASAKRELENFLETTPWYENLKVKYSQDLWEIIIEDYQNLAGTALQTLILVFVIIFIFVWFRESLIASILLPLAFFITFMVLDGIGFSLNFLTNFSLVLTLGIAIDTIIVIIEWASERQKLWYSRKNAVILAVRDLKSPLISGTATTLVAFLPMIFLPWVLWRFLSYIPITVFVTLLWALILSLTLATALFYKLSKKKTEFHRDASWEESLSQEEEDFLVSEREWKAEKKEWLNLREKFLNYMGEVYCWMLWRFLRSRISRITSICIPIVLLILSFVVLSPKIWFILFPAADEWVIEITIESREWSSKERLERYIPNLEELLSSYEEMKVFYVSLQANVMSVYIELTNSQTRQSAGQRDVFEIERDILEKLDFLRSDGLLVEVKTAQGWPATWAPVGIKFHVQRAEDINLIKEVSDDFKSYLQTVEGTKNVSATSSDTPGQFVFVFDREALAYSWLKASDLLWEIRQRLAGVSAWSVGSTYEDNDIILSLDEFEDGVRPYQILDLEIPTQAGMIRIGDYASYELIPGLSSITRENGKITIGVNSDVQPWVLPSDIQPWLIDFAETYIYPSGVSYSAWGENEENAELINATLQSFFIALFLIFTILVFQFNSYSQPVIILYSVVLALLWVNIGLFVTGNPYSMTFGIWFIALTWVVVNDAIILVDRINRNLDRLVRNAGNKKLVLEDYVNSLVAAGRSRLQPIIVTTLTTLFWILPLALQDAFWAGLWYTVIFGLFTGSFMTLFIIPALYYAIYLGKKMNR